jgi:1,4-dihydroxy-2-naphthoyl-CoA hydrolase
VQVPIDADAAEAINAAHVGTWAGVTGLVVRTATRDEVVAELAIRGDHRQPHGIVHGGVYAGVIESICSVGAVIDAARNGMTVVGLENTTSFIRAARDGVLRATARPLTRGRRTQVWEASITNEDGALLATGRVRLLALDPASTVGGAEIGGKPR